MLSNFPKTTSEHWRRTPGTQKGSPFSSKGGRAKYKTQKYRQELGMETHPEEGVVKEEQLFPNSRKTSHWWVCGEFWNLKGQHNPEEKKNNKTNKQTKKPTDYTSNCNSQRRCSPDAHICYQWQELYREAWVACLG